MRQRKWRNTFRSLPAPRKSWLYWVYAFVLGALPVIIVTATTGKLGLLHIVAAVSIWFGCLVIWFVAERLI